MNIKAFVLAALTSSLVAGAWAASPAVPMKDYHQRAFNGQMQCVLCHKTEMPTAPASDEGCRTCHGTMDKIATPDNAFDKKPHASAHFGDTLECTACHAEHKPSRDLCSTCHKVQWKNFK